MFKRYIANAMLALLLNSVPVVLHAQEPQKPQTSQTASASSSEVKVSGLGLNTTRYDRDIDTSTVSLTFFNFPESELWLVGGQNYDSNNQNNFDLGLKYVRGKDLLRGTLVYSKSTDGKEKVSGGVDWDALIGSYQGIGISLLGDVSSVDRDKRHTDFGIGTKLNFSKDHNAFFLYSNRSEEDTNSYRIGYMFLDKEKLAALVVDHPEKGKPAFTGFLGLPEHRFVLSYDPNNHDISSINILTFGNASIPYYARALLLSNQYILTQHSVSDSDANHVFQSPFFLEPKRKISAVARLHFSYDIKKDALKNLYFYNALMIGTRNKQGLVLTQNIDKTNGNMYHGGGVGYKFGNVTPVIIFQTGDNRRVTFDLNFSY